jgi:kynurenine formamidase
MSWRGGVVKVVASVAAVVTLACGAAFGQADRWYPSQWGTDDQRGAANRLTPAKVLEAKALVTTGRVYQLGRVYEAGMPMYGTRHYSLRIPQPFDMGSGNEAVYLDEVVSGELGQIGTQFDGLGHLGIGDLHYNGNRRSEFATAEGLIRLGIEHVGPIVTRGVLLDVAGYKGVDRLDAQYVITAADVGGALARQGVGIHEGDVVLIHTGWGALWMVDNERFGASEPGIDVEAAEMLAGAGVVVVGADTWGVEIMPNPDPDLAAPVHQLLLDRHGIYLHENLATEDLARDGVYEFMYVFTPLLLKGATGSPGGPIAIR